MNNTPLREFCDWVMEDPLVRQVMIAQQENTRRAAAEQIRRQAQWTPSELATLQGYAFEAKLATAAETSYVVEESKQLPVHEEEKRS